MADAPQGYDTDLPPLPVAQPRDPATGQYQSPAADPTPAVVAEPAQPVHHPYMLAKARQLGVTVTTDMTPESLGFVLSSIESQQAESRNRPEPPAQTKVQEPAVDWGENDDGSPMTEEQARKAYTRPVFLAIKKAAQIDAIAAENKTLRESVEQDRRERAGRQAVRSLDKVLAGRPDLFGANPAEAKPGSPEALRRQAVINHLNGLVAAKQHTTLEADATAALAMFGVPAPAPPTPAKPKAPGLVDGYRNAELARPSGRRGGEVVSRRDAMIQEQAAKRAETNGSFVASFGDDNDDLPDAPRG